MISKASYKGYLSFLDLHDMANLSPDFLQALPKTNINGTIVKNPSADNLIFLCDLQTHDAGWGGTFRCFLYPDSKVLGSYQYLKEANKPDDKIDGDYDMGDDNVVLTVKVLKNGTPSYGVFFYLEQV